MPTLSDTLRSKLENAVGKARDQAEKGSRAALEALEVHLGKTTRELTAEERLLRKSLRAHGRQLGDRRDSKTEAQAITHLVWECAYQHWHRMLFARFLAENHVLIHPELKVPVTLEECGDLAAEEGVEDAWVLAGRYAARMLPQIFRPDHPALQLRLPSEHQRALENLLADLPPEVFTARDSLGWVYQFWQAKRKDEINKSEVKIGADELPAVTQLFTEPYMVDFLLHNSLGAWWVGVGRELPDGLELPYLRFLDGGTPAAGKFEGWPKRTAELKMLDPCCGSGHFLVAAFDLLARFRMAEEGLSPADACNVVLRDNLHGLEIDERCTQIAAFALALAAWTFPGSGGWRPLPAMNVACSGLSVAVMPRADETEEEKQERMAENKRRRDRWNAAAGRDERKRQGMMRLFDLFAEAPVLGSLIDPTRDSPQTLLVASAEELRPVLERVMDEVQLGEDEEERESRVAAAGIAAAARLLGERYHLVMTNVPYLTRSKQTNAQRDYAERHYSDAKSDLANVFLERCHELSKEGSGVVQLVMPQNWLFLSSYRRQREMLLKAARWNILACLGPGAFVTISGEVVNVILLIQTRASAPEDFHMRVIDISQSRTAQQKAGMLQAAEFMPVSQTSQAANPDARIVLETVEHTEYLSAFGFSYQGIKTSDDPRFVARFWEHDWLRPGWEYYQSTVDSHILFGGRQSVILFERGQGKLRQLAAGQERDRRRDLQGVNAWGRCGVSVSLMGDLPATLYAGEKFDTNASALVPYSEARVLAIWCYCSSPEFSAAVRKIDRSLKVPNATLVKVPFDLAYWQQVAAERYPNGLPKPYSDDPTQWIFHGHPLPSSAPLQVAVARLLGYTWPAEKDEKLELSDEARGWIARCEALAPYAEKDGIACLPAVRGADPAAERLQALLATAFGDAWGAGLLEQLLKDADCPGWSLERWLRDRFFEQHCALFHQRPFIWHISDQRKDGFAALVNYHTLTHKRLEALTYDHLGDWIRRQQDESSRSVDGAGERLRAAVWLQQTLEAILKGEAPLDIFVRWKPLETQAIGWEPDLNDGVRLNIRPFVQAGVLRKDPKIKWEKDRGKDPKGFPWGEERINDRHLSLAEKERARAASLRRDAQ